MEALVKTRSDLQLGPKYWDLEVRCDGIIFYVHRDIVRSKSRLLARECDGHSQATFIEVKTFNALTVERMLLFMYTGDYDVELPFHDDAKDVGTDEGARGLPTQDKVTPPHICNKTFATKNIVRPAINSGFAAHAHLHALADHYGMPDLKGLTLQRLRDFDNPVSISQFFEASRAVCRTFSNMSDPFLGTLAGVFLHQHADWLADEEIMSYFATDPSVQPFCAALLRPLSRSHAENMARRQKDVLIATSASCKTHLDLDRMREDVASVKAGMEELKKRNIDRKGNLANAAKSNTEVEELKKQNDTLKQDLNEAKKEKMSVEEEAHKQAGVHTQETDNANKQKSILEKKLKESETWRKELFADAGKHFNLLVEKDVLIKKGQHRADELTKRCRTQEETLKQETARANLNSNLCNQKDDLIKQEKARADANRNLCLQKDELIKLRAMALNEKQTTYYAQKLRADQAENKFRQVVNISGSIGECRHCEAEHMGMVETDRHTGEGMIRCGECDTKHYERHI